LAVLMLRRRGIGDVYELRKEQTLKEWNQESGEKVINEWGGNEWSGN
jgi:hypothetical protein